MGGRRTIEIVALAMSVAGLSCQSGSFTCSSNASCSGLEGGACESNGRCSLPNPDCVSGREYAEFSGDASGECVPAIGGGSSTGSEGSTGEPGESSDVEPVLTTSTTGADSTTTEDASSSSSSGALLEGSGDTTAGEESGTTGMPPCGTATPAYQHNFADGMFAADDWNINTLGQVNASYDGGTLTVSMEGDGVGSDGWWIVSTFPTPPAGSVAMELVEAPTLESAGSFWLELPSSRMTLSFAVRDAQLRTSIKTGDGPYVVQVLGPYDPVDDLWLRLNYDAGATTVVAQTSPDGLSWSTFHEFDTTGFGFGDFGFDIGGGVFNDADYTGVLASVRQIAVCED